MISAIVFSSKTGHTKEYAALLSEQTGLPAYELGMNPPGDEVIYLGWLQAGAIVGLDAARKRWKVPCVCAVGMTPPSQALEHQLRRKNKVLGEDRLFYLQGGLDLAKLPGPMKLAMTALTKFLGRKLAAMPERNEGEEAAYRMTQGPYSAVSAAQLADVLDWYRKQ